MGARNQKTNIDHYVFNSPEFAFPPPLSYQCLDFGFCFSDFLAKFPIVGNMLQCIIAHQLWGVTTAESDADKCNCQLVEAAAAFDEKWLI